MFKLRSPLKNIKGFTLVEIMVALVISAFFLLALTNFFISTNKINTVQQKVSEVQQNVRTLMEFISKDLRMAGLDPSGTASCAGFKDGSSYLGAEKDKNNTDGNSISITFDYNGNGDCSDPGENVAYWYDSSNGVIHLRRGSGENFYPMTEEDTIDSIVFSYTLDDGTIDPDPSANGTLNNISMVTIKICGKITGSYSDEFDSVYCFENEVKLRNM